MKSGIDYMVSIADWYRSRGGDSGFGFFQIGGGIAGDFPICVVPMLEQDTWGKLSTDTPRFIVESDASIVAPLIFAYVLGW